MDIRHVTCIELNLQVQYLWCGS